MRNASLYVVGILVALLGCRREVRQITSRDDLTSRLSPSALQPVYPTTGVEIWDPLPTTTSSNLASLIQVDSVSPEEERKVIDVVKRHLDLANDADEFKVSRDGTGYSVSVQFFSLDSQGNKVTYVGGHCVVKLSSDLKVVRVFRGA
jgi:hypothetical protein